MNDYIQKNINERYFEDYPQGCSFEFGPVVVEEEEVIAFARKYDPQPFHIDHAAARGSIYGSLIASGWHTVSMMMRVLVDNYLSSTASLGSPGIDELRWNLPVRPGDRLFVNVSVIDARRSRSRHDRGIITSLIEVRNQDREKVMSLKAVNFLLCRGSSVHAS